MENSKVSKNKLAERIVGKRDMPSNAIIFDQPCELDYHCPVCKYKNVVKGNYDERLQWSEYNGFIWCGVCNKDYPSTLCQPDIDKAIKIYLECVLEAKAITTHDLADLDRQRDDYYNRDKLFERK